MTALDPVLIARGARGRTLRRLLEMADRRAQRRFRVWLDASMRGASDPTLYHEAERLIERILAARYGR